MGGFLDKKKMIQAVIPSILVALSLLFLFKPWMSISLSVVGKQYTISSFLEALPYSIYSNAEQFDREIYNGLIDASEELADVGIYMDPQKAMESLKLLEDSEVSPFEMARISWFTGRLLTNCKPYFDKLSQTQRLDYFQSELIASLSRGALITTVLSVVLFSLIGFSVISALVSIYCLYKDKRSINIVNIVFNSLLLIIFIVLSIIFNKGINDLFSQYSSDVSDIFSLAGMGYSSSMKLQLFHILGPGFLCLFFSILSLLVYEIERKLCFNNHKSQNVKKMFIGIRRPKAIYYCEMCGNKIKNDERFCPYCGKEQT